MELLERAAFLRTLAEYAAEARRGDGRLVLLSGESGMGKTVLLEAFQQSTSGARWLWGGCDGLLTLRPLGPLFDISAQLGGDFDALCHSGAHRDRLFTGFLAELGPPAHFTVAVVEDAHWADEATIDLLSFLGRRLGRIPALLLVSYRDDELAADHPLRMVLGDLATHRATRRMRLPPLSEDAVREMIGQRDVDAAELRRITGGNPFYVSEMLEAGWPSVPPTVRDSVGARLARVSAGARRAIETAAVIGARVDPALLAWLLAEARTSADECLATGILVPDGTGLRFRHELVRMAIEAGIAPHRKAELHGRLLAALEERGNADPALLAHHAEGAGDAGAVLRHAPDAAYRSAALGAHREAAAQFERALRNSAKLGKPTLAELYEGAATEYSLLDRWEDAEKARRTALALRRELGDLAQVGANLRVLGTTLWRLCRGEECVRAFEEAAQVLRTLPPTMELVWTYGNLAVESLSLRGGADAAFAYLGKAREIAEQLGDPETGCFVLSLTGELGVATGTDDTGQIVESLRLAIDADLPVTVGRSYSSLMEACAKLNRTAQSDRYYADGLAYCEDHELSVYTLCLNGWRARTLLQAGRWDEAVRISEGMLASRGISPVNQLNPLCVLGIIRGRRGEDGAWELLDRALGFALGTGESLWLTLARAARAELRWLEGDLSGADAEARTGYEKTAGADPWTFGSLAIWRARLGGAPGPRALPEPYALEAAGDHGGSAAAWTRIGRPYDAALARLGSRDEAGLKAALADLEDLGAKAAAVAARRRMRELGVRAIPRGPRAATRAAPAGLTPREQEVLALLAVGLADREISEKLVISERTVHHHVSAVLAKVGASSRTAAAREAAKLGILAQG